MKRISVIAVAFAVAITSFSVAQAQSTVDVSETVLDFGNVEMGVPKIDIVTVMNTSTENVITTCSIVGTNGFSTTFSGFAFLAPGTSVDFTVEFDPLSLGDATDVLMIEVNPEFSADETIPVELIGTGGFETDPGNMIDEILMFFDDSVANGTLTSTGNNSNQRLRALRNRIRAIDFLIQKEYYEFAAIITYTAILRTDGLDRPKDLVEGPAAEELHEQLLLLLAFLDA